MNSTHKRVLLAVVAAAILASFVTGCGRSSVAKIDGRKITRQEYYNRLERLPYPDPMTGQTMEAGAWVLQRLINEEIILRLAQKEGVSPTEDQIKERLAYAQKQPGFAATLKASGLSRDQLREFIRVEQALFNIQTRGVKVSEEEVKEFYEENKEAVFTTPEQADVAAIFINSKADADKAMDLLNKGVDFSTVARTLSTEPESKKHGGRLPVALSRGDQAIPEFVQNLVFNTEKNKFTQPIPYGDGGFVIFQMLQRRPERTRKFEDVKYSIRQQLMVEKGLEKNTELERELDEVRKAMKMDIKVERFRKILLPDEEETQEAATQDEKEETTEE